MIIKKLQPRFKQQKITLEDGSTALEEVEVGNQIVLKEISELIEFEQIPKSTKGVYKKRCIVYCESGAFIAPYSFEELCQLKHNTTSNIGFKIPHHGKRRTARRRNLSKPNE